MSDRAVAELTRLIAATRDPESREALVDALYALRRLASPMASTTPSDAPQVASRSRAGVASTRRDLRSSHKQFWHMALRDREGKLVLDLGYYGDTQIEAEIEARRRGFYESAELDGLSVAIVPAAPPSWWPRRRKRLAAVGWEAKLWPTFRQQLAGIPGLSQSE